MGMIKNYLLQVLEQCSEENFGQEAVQHAIDQGWVVLTGNLSSDVAKIMAEYDTWIEQYQKVVAYMEAPAVESLGPEFDTSEEAA